MHRIPALDGLRGVAILLVVISHLKFGWFFSGGPVGVTLFFVLSGYLITGILIRRPGLKRFYGRRARRLLPALIVVVAVATVLSGEVGNVWPVLGYIANLVLIGGGDAALGNLSHTWSLAVEEHFYLIWPLAISFIPAARRKQIVMLLLAVALLWRINLFMAASPWLRIYFGSDTNAFALLAGCYLAVTSREPSRWKGWLAVVGLVGLSLIPDGGFPAPLATFTVVPVAAVAVRSASSVGPLQMEWLRWFGSISYGLYLWQNVVFWGQGPWGRLVLLPLAVGLAALSWYVVERPWLEAAPDRALQGPEKLAFSQNL